FEDLRRRHRDVVTLAQRGILVLLVEAGADANEVPGGQFAAVDKEDVTRIGELLDGPIDNFAAGDTEDRVGVADEVGGLRTVTRPLADDCQIFFPRRVHRSRGQESGARSQKPMASLSELTPDS